MQLNITSCPILRGYVQDESRPCRHLSLPCISWNILSPVSNPLPFHQARKTREVSSPSRGVLAGPSRHQPAENKMHTTSLLQAIVLLGNNRVFFCAQHLARLGKENQPGNVFFNFFELAGTSRKAGGLHSNLLRITLQPFKSSNYLARTFPTELKGNVNDAG